MVGVVGVLVVEVVVAGRCFAMGGDSPVLACFSFLFTPRGPGLEASPIRRRLGRGGRSGWA